MFKKISPCYRDVGGSVSASGYSVIAPLEKNGVKKFVDSVPSQVYPELPAPEHFSLKAQSEAGITIKQVNPEILPPIGNVDTVISRIENESKNDAVSE